MKAQEEFIALLREIFQIQDLDLDFGIYRVLNQERRHIEKFLDERIEPLTREALGAADAAQRSTLEEELETLAKGARELGVKPEDSPKWQAKKAELDALGTSAALETDVYNGLAEFFGRYYDKGDFLSRPRYRKDVYALPYNGEEVKLHWANRDQYYIKSAQVLETFEWKLDGLPVRFQLREAGHAENNNKEERSFVLAVDENEKPVVEKDGDRLTVYFDFKKEKGDQRKLNAAAEEKLREWKAGVKLVAPLLAPWKPGETKSHFLHRLNGWTARGSFDFFIHKDLRGFLTRELDFYLKNEVLPLEALFQGEALQWQKTTLAKAKAMHALGGKIIEFLASLENLQKRLWEKQKWVTNSRLVLPLARIPAALQNEVLDNEAQLEEWQTLYGVQDEPISTVNPVAWSTPPSAAWAEQHGDIAVDTKHFDAAFTRRLWSELSKEHTLDELWNGVLWNADNFAALNLMQKRFKEEVKCIYIDPPYNTGGDGFRYKDAYQHSSWLSMMQDRLEKARELMSDDGLFYCQLDNIESARLKLMLDDILHFERELIWSNESSSGFKAQAPNWIRGHDTIYFYSVNGQPDFNKQYLELAESTKKRYDKTDPDTGEKYKEYFDDDGTVRKVYLHQSQGKPVSTVWSDIPSFQTDNAAREHISFDTQKPIRLIDRILQSCNLHESDIILDYFAGSGTTGHAVINLNRADGEDGQQRFVLVEMGRYFETVLVPRLKKAAFAEKWKDGRPAEYSTRNAAPQTLLVHRLESYEDALEHLAAVVEKNGQAQLGAPDDDDFTVRYAVSVDTRDGEKPLADALFAAPFWMRMKVGGDEAGQSTRVALDAVATFNWLLGLRVHKLWFVEAENGKTPTLAAVCGLLPDERPAVVVWRQLAGQTYEEADAALLEFWRNDAILKQWREQYSVAVVYLNGDSTQWRSATQGESWMSEPLESTFRELMFATSPTTAAAGVL